MHNKLIVNKLTVLLFAVLFLAAGQIHAQSEIYSFPAFFFWIQYLTTR